VSIKNGVEPSRKSSLEASSSDNPYTGLQDEPKMSKGKSSSKEEAKKTKADRKESVEHARPSQPENPSAAANGSQPDQGNKDTISKTDLEAVLN